MLFCHLLFNPLSPEWEWEIVWNMVFYCVCMYMYSAHAHKFKASSVYMEG
jgi:hypothetical protein